MQFNAENLIDVVKPEENPIKSVIAVDGGYTEVVVQSEFPSSTLAFFQFGALIFSIEDLDSISGTPFIDPEDMSKLRRIQRLKLSLPIKNITVAHERTLTHSVRRALHDFFNQDIGDGSLNHSLKWLVFSEFLTTPNPSYVLASCPHCNKREVELIRSNVTATGTCPCSSCHASLYLIDVFRLHEAVDDEIGAGGILGYVTTTIEQLILAHLIRVVLITKPTLLQSVLFVKDGPLAFFGQTANLHKLMRALVVFLFEKHNLYLVGLEKSGAFVEHADEVRHRMKDGSALILSNSYIYKYIIPGVAEDASPYGRTTYYGNKVIYKTSMGAMYVATIPTTASNANPNANDLRNLSVLLANVEKLRCDMYDSALVPIALVNKLVSLANHPSSKLLEKFAIDSVRGKQM